MNEFIVHEPDTKKFKVAILINENGMDKKELEKHYIDPLVLLGNKKEDFISFTLPYDKKKPSASFAKEFLIDLLEKLKFLNVEYILCADAEYFKYLTKKKKVTSYSGYVLDIAGFEYPSMKTIIVPNFQSLFYNPSLQRKIDSGLNALSDALQGSYLQPGDIIQNAYYPDSYEEIYFALLELHIHPELTIDIETRSLQINKAGLETIAFSWNDHSGIAFCIDKGRIDPVGIRTLLFKFLSNYKGRLIYHNVGFDVKILIYELWMRGIDDIVGLLEGLEVLTKNIDDTQIIAYLSLNTTAGNKLSLKDLSQEHCGSYSMEDIKDTTKISREKLLEYNLTDTCATFWVKNKYYPIMVKDQQEDIYKTMMLPSQKVLIQTELSGMCMDMGRVLEVEEELIALVNKQKNILNDSVYIQNFKYWLQHYRRVAGNAKLKVKVKPYSDFPLEFNEGSGKQKAALLYNFIGLEVEDTTDTGLPATGNKEISKLIHKANPETVIIIKAIMEINTAQKIIGTFIKAFKEKSILHSDGYYYLHGNFNLTGTKSMRLSSSNPNLANLPSNSIYGKLIKTCFISPAKHLMLGSDYNALESRIAALLTQDPQFVKVYTQGYDSHCNATFHYWPNEFPNIVDTPESVNTIADKYPEWRQRSKQISFAALYGGTYHTFMDAGFSEKEAKEIEANYHAMHEVSDTWVDKHIIKACKIGYVPLAFGGRLRTPVLAQVVYGNNMPYKAQEERRTAGNALMQSYCTLTVRALFTFMKLVWKSEYRYKIKPICTIHDSIYFNVENTVGCIRWINSNLINVMGWTGLPEIRDSRIPLTAELDIHYPSWANTITLKNNASKCEILKACKGK